MTVRWPNPLDYDEAVQFAEVSFNDPELQKGEVELTPLGLPRVASGNFASVYRMDCGLKSYAVKCFLRNVSGQSRRYSMISDFTSTSRVEHMVYFEYQKQGIKIEGDWFPIVKMDWVDGLGLDQFIRKNWTNKAQISRVISQFETLMLDLKDRRIAHCDLQHGNILVKNDSMRLVDYDGMFVPAMAGEPSSELGHSNYQHRDRSERDFGPSTDNFSAWIIYFSLLFLKLDPSLWQRFEGGEDCLLFRKSDYNNPASSRLLAELANHAVPEIKERFPQLKRILESPLDRVPPFPADDIPQIALTSPAAKPAPVYPERWPTIEQYFRAALRPPKSFSDEKLRNSVPVPTEGKTTSYVEADATTRERLTVNKTVIVGSSNMVLHMIGEGGARHYAVKLFLKDLPDRHTRYLAIHRHKKTQSNRYFVPFVYQHRGIFVEGNWFPILKMLWVHGETIEAYVNRQLKLGNTGAIEELLPKFVRMIKALAEDGIAHGDLEPGNILVDEEGNLKLVDYDCMYVPALASLQSCELGIKLYQHPARSLNNFGNYLDNFSSLALYGVLSCMTRMPPQQFWRWDTLLRQVRSQSSQLRGDDRRDRPQGRPLIGRGSSDGYRMPKQYSSQGKEEIKIGIGQPVFEKVTHEDLRGDQSFKGSMERMTRVLQEQHKRRIDQVSRLDLSMWNLA